jgi:hypothetical protein
LPAIRDENLDRPRWQCVLLLRPYRRYQVIHSSGTSIAADLAMGEPSDRIFDEATSIQPLPERAARVAIDRLVLASAGIRSVVLCNAMIYGDALGPPAQSVQIPALVRQAKASGVVRYIGRGLNR